MKPLRSIMPEREAVAIEPRRPLTRREVIELAVRQGGRCGCGCGVKLDALREGVIDEHRVPLALGGANDLDNRELWRAPCSKAKTATKDAPAIGKVKRLRGETCAGPKKPIPQRPGGGFPPKGFRKLRGRPFPKRESMGGAG